MDMIPDKNAYAAWLHLNEKCKPSNENINAELKIKLGQKREECTVYKQMMQMKQGEQWHGKQQEKENYCYIDLFEEDFQENEWETKEREHKDENEPLVNDDDDNWVREEDVEEDEHADKFPIKLRDAVMIGLGNEIMGVSYGTQPTVFCVKF